MRQLLFICSTLILVCILRHYQYLEISAAKFDVKNIKSNIVWYRFDKPGEWYPLSESSSQFSFEDGLIDLFPDYSTRFIEFMKTHSGYTYQIEFPDGDIYQNTDQDPEVCIYLKEFDKSVECLNPIKNRLKANLNGILDFNSSYKNKGQSHFHKGVLFETEMEITGFYSNEYVDYKLKEIWLNHLNDVLYFHLKPYRNPAREEDYSTHTAGIHDRSN